MDDVKKPWQSKTLWIGLVVAIAPFFPPAQAVLIANPELVGMFVGALFAGLRVVSEKKLVLKKQG